MTKQPSTSKHSIGKQRLNITIDSEAQALALHPHLPELNRRRFLPVFERVFDEFVLPEQHIKIEKLTLNLGRFELTQFEPGFDKQAQQEIEQRLEEVLRETLQVTLKTPNACIIEPENVSQLQLLGYYLVNGILPWHSHNRSSFCFESLFLILLKKDPNGLLKEIKSHSQISHVIERIVLQLQPDNLTQLLQLLDPKHGNLIIAYLLDLNASHNHHPLLNLNRNAFNQLVWILALTYTLNERGSQFNRQSFVKSLLQGLAQSEGVQYSELLDLLNLGLQQLVKSQPIYSSLPAVIVKLASEQKSQSNTASTSNIKRVSAIDHDPLNGASINQSETQQTAINSALARLEYYLNTGLNPDENYKGPHIKPEFVDLFTFLGGAATTRTLNMIKALASQSQPGLATLITRLLKVFPAADLLFFLASKEQSLVEQWAKLLMGSCAHIPSVAKQPMMKTQRLVWQALLYYLIEQASTPWQAQQMVQTTIYSVADQLGINVGILLNQLTVLAENHSHSSVKNVLSQALSEITEQQLGQYQAFLDESLSHQAFSYSAVLKHYDQLEYIRHYLYYGVLPWQQLIKKPELTSTSAQLVSLLTHLPAQQLALIFNNQTQARSLKMLLRMAQELSSEKWQLVVQTLLTRLVPQKNDRDGHFHHAISLFLAKARDKNYFYAQLLSTLLAEQAIDFDALLASENTPVSLALPKLLDNWHQHQLESVLIAQLKQTDPLNKSAGKTYLNQDIFKRLLSEHQGHSEQFVEYMLALNEQPAQLQPLLMQSSEASINQLINTIQPKNAALLTSLLQLFASVAMPYRPNMGELRQVIVSSALHIDQTINEAFFVRILTPLFSAPLSAPVQQYLAKSADNWLIETHRSSPLSTANIAAFKAAIGNRPAKDPKQLRSSLISKHQAEHQQTLFSLLLAVNSNTSYTRSTLQFAISQLFEQSPKQFTAFIRQHINKANIQAHWIKILPESALVRIGCLLQPLQFSSLLNSAKILTAAWLTSAPAAKPNLADRGVFWRFLLQFSAQKSAANSTLENLTTAFFNTFVLKPYSTKIKDSQPQHNNQQQIISAWRDSATQLARKAGINKLVAVLHALTQNANIDFTSEKNNTKLQQARNTNKPQQDNFNMKQKMNRAPSNRENRLNLDQALYIDNAGLVILVVYLPHLFKSLDMLTTDEKGTTRLRDRASISRAVHLLQYLVDGSTDTPEPQLALNKLICGVPLSTAIEPSIEITAQEIEICQQLLTAVITRWGSISSTSVGGLQEAFLQREGRLSQTEDSWKLTVQRKTLDLLVDQIPWRLSIISQAWIPTAIHVTW
jgi:hypothetical protein